jgi:hypothetical protein
VVKPIRDAFREVFPATTGQQLYEMTKNLREFTERLKMGATASAGLKATFKGIFSIFSIGQKIFSGVFSLLGRIFGLFSTGTGSVLTLTGSFGDMITKVNEFLEKSDLIGVIFDKIGDVVETVLKPVIKYFGQLSGIVADLATGGFDQIVNAFEYLAPIMRDFGSNAVRTFNELKTSLGPVRDMVERIKDSFLGLFDFGGGGSGAGGGAVAAIQTQLEPVADLGDRIRATWDRVTQAFSNAIDKLRPIGDNVKKVFTYVKQQVVDFFADMGLEEGLAIVNTGFFIAFYRMMKGFFGEMKGLVASAKGMFDSVGGVLEQVTSNLKTMQADVRADIIMKIAASLALLAGAIWVLSKVDPAGLATGLAAIGVMLAMLVKALKALEDNTSTRGSINLAILTVGLVGISIALIAMAGAIALLGNMDTDTIIRGLGAVAGILAVVVAASAVLGTTGGAGQMVLAAGAMLILSAALTAIAGVIKLYEAMDTGEMAKGIAKIAGVLIALGISMQFFPPNMLVTSAGLFVVAAALTVLAGVMKIYGSMGMDEMAKSIGMLAYSLGIIAVAVNVMTGALGGAAALLVVAGALAIIAPVLMMLGQLPLKVIGIGLLAIAGVFAVLGVAGYLLAPVAPVILLLAKGIGLLGLAALAAGVGMLAFATGLATLAAVGAAGAAALGAMIIVVAESIPLVMQQFGLGIIAFAKVIEESGPPLARAMTVALLALLQAIRNVAPSLGKTILVLLDVILKVLVNALPKIQRAGYELIIRLMQGVANNIPRVARAGANIIIAFMQAIGREGPRIARQAMQTIITFTNGLASAIRDNSDEMNAAGRNLADAIIDGAANGIRDGAGAVAGAAWDMAVGAWNSAMEAIGARSPARKFILTGKYADQGMAIGLTSYAGVVNKAASGMAEGALDEVSSVMSRIGESISGDIDMSPVIAPVIDLDQFRKDAAQMQGAMPDPMFGASVSYGQASGIAREAEAAAAARLETQDTPTVFQFEQNNYSPKELSTTEIYRRTNNQMSQAKKALGIAS